MSQAEVCLGNQQIVENAVSPPIGNTSKPDHVTVTHKRQLPDAIDEFRRCYACCTCRQINHIALAQIIVFYRIGLRVAVVEVRKQEGIGTFIAPQPVVAPAAIQSVITGPCPVESPGQRCRSDCRRRFLRRYHHRLGHRSDRRRRRRH